MAGRDWRTGNPRQETSIVYIRLPNELVFLAKRYQAAKRCLTISDAYKRLLETHPEILALASEMVYTGTDTSPITEKLGHSP